MQSLRHCNYHRHRAFVTRDVLVCCLIASNTHRLICMMFTLSGNLDLSKCIFCGIVGVKIGFIFRILVILKLRWKNTDDQNLVPACYNMQTQTKTSSKIPVFITPSYCMATQTWNLRNMRLQLRYKRNDAGGSDLVLRVATLKASNCWRPQTRIVDLEQDLCRERAWGQLGSPRKGSSTASWTIKRK